MKKHLSALSITLFALTASASETKISTPESILPKGADSTVSVNPYTGKSCETRKGTIAATLNNVATLNKLFGKEKPTAQEQKEISDIDSAIQGLIEPLDCVGMFHLFPILDWLDKNQPGKILVAIRYLQKNPDRLKENAIQARVKDLKTDKSSSYLKDRWKELVK